MRGVPRLRLAISRSAGGSHLEVEQRRGAEQHLLELVGRVELEVRGEPEPVAEGVRQQPGPGRRADQRERRQVERDRRRAGALADHDVDPEVLHREVEHLLRGARHAVDLVDEQHLARRQRREHRGEVAGVLDRRAARHAQRPVRLLRDDHRERRLAEAGRAGEQDVVRRAVLHRRGLQQHLQLLADVRLADELGEVLRAERALERELRLRLRDRVDGAHRTVCGPSAESAARRSTAVCRSSGRSREHLVERGLRGALLVAEADERDEHVGAARRRAPRGRAGADGDQLAGERHDDQLRGLRPDARHPAEDRVLVVRDRGGDLLRAQRREHAHRGLRAHPGDAAEQVEDLEPLPVREAEQGHVVLAHDHRRVDEHLLARAHRQRVVGRDGHRVPDAVHVDDQRRPERLEHGSAERGDHALEARRAGHATPRGHTAHRPAFEQTASSAAQTSGQRVPAWRRSAMPRISAWRAGALRRDRRDLLRDLVVGRLEPHGRLRPALPDADGLRLDGGQPPHRVGGGGQHRLRVAAGVHPADGEHDSVRGHDAPLPPCGAPRAAQVDSAASRQAHAPNWSIWPERQNEWCQRAAEPVRGRVLEDLDARRCRARCGSSARSRSPSVVGETTTSSRPSAGVADRHAMLPPARRRPAAARTSRTSGRRGGP